MSSKQIWHYYWNPILLVVLVSITATYINFSGTKTNTLYQLLAEWPNVSLIIGYIFEGVSVIAGLFLQLHILFISWVVVLANSVGGIYKVVTRGPKSISKHGLISGILVACTYLVVFVYVYKGMVETYGAT